MLFATEALLNEHGKSISGQRFVIQVLKSKCFRIDYLCVKTLAMSLSFRVLEMWVLGRRS